MSVEGITEGLVGDNIPENHGPVAAAGSEDLAIGAEGDTRHGTRMGFEGITEGLVGDNIPENHGPVAAAGSEDLAIGAESDTRHGTRMSFAEIVGRAPPIREAHGFVGDGPEDFIIRPE